VLRTSRTRASTASSLGIAATSALLARDSRTAFELMTQAYETAPTFGLHHRNPPKLWIASPPPRTRGGPNRNDPGRFARHQPSAEHVLGGEPPVRQRPEHRDVARLQPGVRHERPPPERLTQELDGGVPSVGQQPRMQPRKLLQLPEH